MAHTLRAPELSKSILFGAKRPGVYSFGFVSYRAVKNLGIFLKCKIQFYY